MSFFFSCSCFPLETHLQSKGKTFQVAAAEYRSNLEGCKWLHCEALKGSKEEERKRAREQESKRAKGSRRLMTLVHWWLEVTKRREEEGWVLHPFKGLMVRVCAVNCYGFSSFGGSYSNRDKQTVLPRQPSQEVELLWPGAPLRWSRQRAFYYVNISLKENFLLRFHIRSPIEFITYGPTDLKILNSNLPPKTDIKLVLLIQVGTIWRRTASTVTSFTISF